jgi:hypothetical protein
MESPDQMHSRKEERPAVQEARRRYNLVNGLLGQLSNKLTGVASNIESEFSAAYRVHMMAIQVEIKELKQRITQAEVALKEDGQVAKLESEVTWFSNESIRLRTHTSNMQKDMQNIVYRIETLREQKAYLSEQLQSIMKRSRVLEAELELASREQEFFNKLTLNETISNTNTTNVLKQSQSERVINLQNRMNRGQAPAALAAIKSRSTPNLELDQETKKKSKLRKLATLAQLPYRDDILLARVNSDAQMGSKNKTKQLEELIESQNKYENDLEKVLDEICQEVVSRRKSAVKQGKSINEESSSATIIGVSGLGVEYFAETDRMQAMIRYLSNPAVFEDVIRELSLSVM